ncbi:MAG: PepSY-associated TM helix domain-containing protein, partial [Bacteroidota bacterium]
MNKGDKRNYNVFFNTHTVSGIIISFGLFVCFFAGAFALFMDNINNWESNKKESHHSKVIDYERALAVVEADGYNMDGRRFSFFLRESKPPYIQISSGKNKVELDTTETGEPIPLSEADSLANASFFLKLDPSTYEIIGRKFERSPQLGTYIYRLHYFGQIPAIGVYLSGLVALFFLFAILTGVIVHWKKIVSNFFTFRLKASIKNLWTDSHTALGIIGLPFQFMYAVTGTFYGLSILILIPTVMILFDGDQEAALKYVFPAGEPVEKANVYQADRVNMNDLVAEAM